jgi:hypothetical protein
MIDQLPLAMAELAGVFEEAEPIELIHTQRSCRLELVVGALVEALATSVSRQDSQIALVVSTVRIQDLQTHDVISPLVFQPLVLLHIFGCRQRYIVEAVWPIRLWFYQGDSVDYKMKKI